MRPIPILRVLTIAAATVSAGCGSPTSPTPVTSTQARVAGPEPSPAVTSSGFLRIDRAVVVEYQYSFGDAHWYYAPQVRVTETSGTGWLQVTGIDVEIPGLVVSTCVAGEVVAAGKTIELFRETYGDYPIAFRAGAPGQRATGEPRFVVRYQQQDGHSGALTVPAPLTLSGLPDSYTGGVVEAPYCRSR